MFFTKQRLGRSSNVRVELRTMVGAVLMTGGVMEEEVGLGVG